MIFCRKCWRINRVEKCLSTNNILSTYKEDILQKKIESAELYYRKKDWLFKLVTLDDLKFNLLYNRAKDIEEMVKLKKKVSIPYSGKVYDLQVKNNPSYNVEGIVVHNSAAGSLVAYLLGITKVNSLKYDLLFERFLNKGRLVRVEKKSMIHIKGDENLDIELDFNTKCCVFRASKKMEISAYELQQGDELISYERRNNSTTEIVKL